MRLKTARRSRLALGVLVVILGCGHREPPVDRVQKLDDAAVVAQANADAATELATDAAIDASALIDASIAMQNPSPPVYVFSIIAIEERDGGTGIAIAAGSRKGIRESWRAFLIGNDDRPVDDGDLVIKQISKDTTRFWSRLFVSRVRESSFRVRFEPR